MTPPRKAITKDQARAGLEITDNILGLVCGCEISKAGEGNPLPYEKELLELFLVEWGNGTKAATEKAIALLRAKAGDLSGREIKRLLKVIPETLEATFVATLGKELPKIVTAGYTKGKKDVIKRLSARFVWEGVDETATEWLYDHHMYWIEGYYDKQVSEYLSNVVAEGMAEGLGREAIGDRLAGFFEDYPGVKSKPHAYWRGFSANGMNRSRNFGMVQGWVNVGVKELEFLAVMDEKTSSICREMNGRIIPVSRCVDQRDELMAATNPEDVKTISPWVSAESIKGKSIGSIMDKGVIMPPLHFHCRSTMVERL